MKKTILFVFFQLVFVILIVSPVLSKIPVPEFYGIYLVANGKLIELKSTKVSFKVNQNGLAQIPSLDIQDSKAYFVIYQKNVNPNELDLAKLKFLQSKAVEFRATPGFKNPYLDSRKVINFNIWVLDGIMKFKVAPIEGKEDMYRLVPEHPLAPGVYAVPAGVFGEVEAGPGGFGGYLESMDKRDMYGGMAYGFTVKADELREKLEKEEGKKEIKALITKKEWRKVKEIGEEAVKPLIALLKDEDRDVRGSAAYALGKIGDKRAVEPLIALLKDEDRDVRWKAAYALGKIGDRRAVKSLIESLNDADLYFRFRAILALGNIGDRRAVNPLIKLLKDKNEYVRRNSAYALGRIGDRQAVEPLIGLLKDEDNKEVRYKVIQALGKIRDKRAIKPLWVLLGKESDELNKYVIAVVLNRMGETVDPLNKVQWETIVENLDYDTGKIIGVFGDERIVKPLITLLTNEEYPVRMGAAIALGKIGDKRAVDPLISLVWDEIPAVRQSAADALGSMGDRRAVEPLIALLNDKDEDVRNAATDALKKLGWEGKQ